MRSTRNQSAQAAAISAQLRQAKTLLITGLSVSLLLAMLACASVPLISAGATAW